MGGKGKGHCSGPIEMHCIGGEQSRNREGSRSLLEGSVLVQVYV